MNISYTEEEARAKDSECTVPKLSLKVPCVCREYSRELNPIGKWIMVGW